MDAARDAEARELAVTETARNVVVTAGAGSGKTSLLVERYLHHVIHGGLGVEAVTAITFTDAAAAEMRERLRGAFARLAGLGEPSGLACDGPGLPAPPGLAESERARRRATDAGTPEALRVARAARALGDLASASITTIHGFAHGLLRRHPFEGGIGPSASIRESDEILRRLEAAWPSVLADLAASAVTLPRLLRDFSADDLRTFYLGLAGTASRLPSSWDDSAAAVARRLLPRARARVEAVAEGSRLKDRERHALRGFLDLADRVARGEEIAVADVKGLPAASSVREPRELGVEMARARHLLAAACHDADDAFRDAVAVLLPAATRAAEELRRAGWTSFDALLVRARDLLLGNVAIRRREARRARALLVDELQDTDPLQYEIVFLLAEEGDGPAATDAWSARLAPGRLFVVGDPKQSIFRFRGADIQACQLAVEHVERQGARRVHLEASHRSPAEVLEPLDALFRPWLGPSGEEERELHAAPEYRPVTSSRSGPDPAYGEGPRVAVWTVEGDERAARRRPAEAALVAADIVAGHLAGIPLRAHAILLRSFSDVAVYTRALAERRVPFVVDGGRSFYRRQEVMDLAALLRAVTEPRDVVALLAVLRGPVGAVPDAELARHAMASPDGAFAPDPAVDAEACPELARAMALLAALRRDVAAMPADEAVDAVLRASWLLALHAASPEGAQRVANLRKLAGGAARLAGDTGASLAEVARDLWRRGGRGGEEEGEPALGDESMDAVSVLTIHRAKGREFPVVYVGDLGRGDPEERRSAALVVRGSGGVSARSSRGRSATALAHLERYLDTVHGAAESRRLLYVAATRARERLVLVGCRGDAPWLRALSAWGHDATSPPEDGALLASGTVLHRAFDGPPPLVALPPPPDVDLAAAARAFVEMTSRVRRRPPLTSPTAMRVERGGEEPRAAGVDREHAFAVGTAVHLALERADFADPASLPRGEALGPLVARACASHPDADPGRVATAADGLLGGMAAGPLWGRLSRVSVLARELPLLAAAEPGERAEAVSGYADLVFEEAGQVVVADWKTDPVEGEEAVSRLSETYRPQVAWYARALARALQRPVRAEILLVAAGVSVDLGTAVAPRGSA